MKNVKVITIPFSGPMASFRVNPINLRPKHEPGSWDDEVFDELGWNPARIEQSLRRTG